MTDIVENAQAETVVTSEREPTFGETLQSAASFCESLKRQGSADQWDFDYLAGKFRDAAFAVSLWDKARGEWLALIASQARRIEELEAEIAALKEGKFWRDELLKASLADRKRAIAALSRLDLRFAEAENDANSGTGMLGEIYANIDVSILRKIISGALVCQCGNCTEVSHASDCAVHNEPALPAGPCDCRARATLKGETT